MRIIKAIKLNGYYGIQIEVCWISYGHCPENVHRNYSCDEYMMATAESSEKCVPIFSRLTDVYSEPDRQESLPSLLGVRRNTVIILLATLLSE